MTTGLFPGERETTDAKMKPCKFYLEQLVRTVHVQAHGPVEEEVERESGPGE